jgi:hypothetical protein
MPRLQEGFISLFLVFCNKSYEPRALFTLSSSTARNLEDMLKPYSRRLRMFRLVAIALCSASVVIAAQVGFVQTNLASDLPGLAQFTDPDLVNAWGMAANATSPVWIGANGSGLSVLYGGAGVKQGLMVSIPGDGSVTGVSFSNLAGSFNGNTFLFDNEDGTVSGWRAALGTTAETLVPGSDANVYKGLTDATIGGIEYAYLANFRSGAIDVLKGNAAAPPLTGNFTDPNLPAGYAPFDVQNLNGILYVTYAVQDAAKHDDMAGPGNGIPCSSRQAPTTNLTACLERWIRRLRSPLRGEWPASACSRWQYGAACGHRDSRRFNLVRRAATGP